MPILGSRHHLRGRPGYLTLTSPVSSQFEPAYKVRFQGVIYTVVIRGDEVVHVTTYDPRFQSPEGLRVGDSLQRVRELGGGEPVARPYWGDYMSTLPSGWYASFALPARLPYPDLSPEARVQSFFQAAVGVDRNRGPHP